MDSTRAVWDLRSVASTHLSQETFITWTITYFLTLSEMDFLKKFLLRLNVLVSHMTLPLLLITEIALIVFLLISLGLFI